MTVISLKLLTICLLLNVSTFLVSAKKELQFVQVLSANKFYVPDYVDSNLAVFEAPEHLDYEYFFKHAVDIPNSVKMQIFNLGTYLRETYGTFLGALYFDQLLKMQTTEFPVSIIAGELINAGLWPPAGEQIWKEDLAWQPVPFEYTSVKEDQIMLGTLCPNFQRETQAVLKKQNMSAEHQNLLSYINKEARVDLKNAIDASLFNLAVENSLESNKTLPEWLNKIYSNNSLLNLTMKGYDLLSETATQKRLNGGPFLKQLIQDCRKHTNKSLTGTKKISIYSGDERNLAGVLNNLNQPIYELPKAGAALIFELYAENEKYYIKTNYYYSGAGKETLKIDVPGCEMFCPIEQFAELLKDVLPEDEMALCGSLDFTKRSSSTMLHSSSNIINVVFLSIVYFSIFCLFH